ncbi:expressed unknown protein [Seminavis robusta]|uniref:Uncharacterized protein n=1 Tax=Seminavis robusta TaxID=568900 RepID=A0A9N8EMH0_9STRA|nr:expressed unknown protein [Seminavis robusta]|eukprot:Sro1463_g274820.1 n/a (263) ;mRNA; r:12210-13097
MDDSSSKGAAKSVLSHAKKSIKKKLYHLTGWDSELGPPEPDPELFALINYQPWNIEDRQRYNDKAVYRHVQENPRSVQVEYEFRNANGRGLIRSFPLNRIIALGASMRTVETVYNAHPPAMVATTEFKSTPLHAACSYAASLDVIEFILQHNPDAIRQTTKHVFLPIHNACQATIPQSTTLPVMQRLVQAFPESLSRIHKLGETPLKMVQRNPHSRPEIVEYLEHETANHLTAAKSSSVASSSSSSSDQFTSSTTEYSVKTV